MFDTVPLTRFLLRKHKRVGVNEACQCNITWKVIMTAVQYQCADESDVHTHGVYFDPWG